MEEDLKNPLEWPCARQCTDVVFFREQPQQNLAVFEALIGALRLKISLVVNCTRGHVSSCCKRAVTPIRLHDILSTDGLQLHGVVVVS